MGLNVKAEQAAYEHFRNTTFSTENFTHAVNAYLAQLQKDIFLDVTLGNTMQAIYRAIEADIYLEGALKRELIKQFGATGLLRTTNK